MASLKALFVTVGSAKQGVFKGNEQVVKKGYAGLKRE